MPSNLQKYRYLREALPDPKTKRLVLLTGARQTGKTTLARLKYPKLRYVNLDAPENRETLRSLSSSLWTRDVGNAVLDEAQKEPLVFEKIKYAFDEGGIRFSVLLGSSQILLLKKIRESLAGRVSVYELWPLLASEIRHTHNAPPKEFPLIDHLITDKRPLSQILKRFPGVLLEKEDSVLLDAESYLLKWGGMPALLSLPEGERWKWLKDYEYTYLERDLGDLARLDDLEPFRKFQRLCALRSGKLLNYSELARDGSVSVDTARRYLEYLRLSYQVILLQPYHKNVTSSVVKSPKIYWLDVGLMRQLSGLSGEATGEIYETMAVGEVFKWIKTMQRNAELFFYRTRSGMELDLLMETEAGMMGIEIKSRQIVASSDLGPMKGVARGLGSHWRGGIVIYRGRELKLVAEPAIWAVPSRRLFG